MLLTAHKGLPVLDCCDVDVGERLAARHILVLTACLAAAILTLGVSHAGSRQAGVWACARGLEVLEAGLEEAMQMA